MTTGSRSLIACTIVIGLALVYMAGVWTGVTLERRVTVAVSSVIGVAHA